MLLHQEAREKNKIDLNDFNLFYGSSILFGLLSYMSSKRK